MTRFLCVAAIAIAAFQGPTDFSGRWTVEPEPPPAAGQPAQPGDMGSGWGSPMTITQDARQLVIEYVHFRPYDIQPPLKLVYALDGSESRNSVMVSHSSQVERSRAAWEGPALGITTVFTAIDPAGKPFTTEVKHRLTLESPTSLVVEVTRAGVLGGKPTMTRKVYKKG